MRKLPPWTDVVVAVTGVASGIGAAAARYLQELGARVVAIDERDATGGWSISKESA
jgi:NAD(P)-dependent dehydrogenase (short-subunit alcohol dehydrogenase family)